MNRKVLGGGAIVCSAVVIYGAAHPLAQKLGIEHCEADEATNSQSSETLTKQAEESCSREGTIPVISDLPQLLPFTAQSRRLQANPLPKEMETVYSNLLEQGQAAAHRDRLADAIASIAGIPKNSQHYDMAQQLQQDWSQELLQRALDRYQQADLAMAQSMLKAIPANTPQYTRAAELRDRWSQEATLLEQAKAAKAAQDWEKVVNTLNALEGTPLYYSLPVQELLLQAMNKRFEADETLLQAASTSTPSIAPIPLDDLPVLPSLSQSIALPLGSPEQPNSAPNSAIDPAQALRWAQPPAPSEVPPAATPSEALSSEATDSPETTTPTKSTKKVTSTNDRSLSGTRMKPFIIPPELFSTLPSQETPGDKPRAHVPR